MKKSSGLVKPDIVFLRFLMSKAQVKVTKSFFKFCNISLIVIILAAKRNYNNQYKLTEVLVSPNPSLSPSYHLDPRKTTKLVKQIGAGYFIPSPGLKK